MDNPRMRHATTAKTPCKTCGAHAVAHVVTMALEPGRELVSVLCATCETTRHRYYRSVKDAD